jgi:NADH:ubiquinone oxidoreductase subunit F (NADH-binding)
VSAKREAGLSPQIRVLPGGERRLLAEIDHIDPTSLTSYREHGGYTGLDHAVTHRSPEEVIAEIEAAGLRGRGGAGFPTAAKPRAARRATARSSWPTSWVQTRPRSGTAPWRRRTRTRSSRGS